MQDCFEMRQTLRIDNAHSWSYEMRKKSAALKSKLNLFIITRQNKSDSVNSVCIKIEAVAVLVDVE